MTAKSMIIISSIAAIVVAGLLLFALTPSSASNRPHFKLGHLTITHANGSTVSFKTELALTPAEQAYGLMFVTTLPDDQAMIFPFDPPRETAFWMKNTLIPLDMLFIAPDHTIGRIVANARPQDETPIPSRISVGAVIEIKGGLAQKDQIQQGDKVLFSR